MPLGIAAKDSIGDLLKYHAEAEAAEHRGADASKEAENGAAGGGGGGAGGDSDGDGNGDGNGDGSNIKFKVLSEAIVKTIVKPSLIAKRRRQLSVGDEGDVSDILVKGGPEDGDPQCRQKDGTVPDSTVSPQLSAARKGVASEEASAVSNADSFDIFRDEVFEPVSFRPNAADGNNKSKKLWCCLLPPWLGGGGKDEDDEDKDGPAIGAEDVAPHLYAKLNSPYHNALEDVPASQGLAHGGGGIMKRGSGVARQVAENRSSGASFGSAASANPRRRSFLPDTYQEKPGSNFRAFIPRHVRFSLYARRTNIKTHREMTMAEKQAIWWQVMDFDQFKKGNAVITRSILEGGSEVWLQDEGVKMGREGVVEGEDDADKWWHQYGHSRRGLEQFVSGDEARQRQRNVKMAMKAVLEEQDRQKTLGKWPDPVKLARVAREYTGWAKDLALAAGASDADAVASDFQETRKSREFFLLKHTLGSQGAVAPHTPQFMMPPGVPTRILDANTSSNVLYRKRMQMQLAAGHQQAMARQQQMQTAVRKQQMQAAAARQQQMQAAAASRQQQMQAAAAARQQQMQAAAARQQQQVAVIQQQQQQTAVAVAPPPLPPPKEPAATAVGGTFTKEEAAEECKEEGDEQVVALNDSSSDLLGARENDKMAKKAAGFGLRAKSKITMAAVMSAYSHSREDEQ